MKCSKIVGGTWVFLGLGFVAGIAGGLIGIGGATIIIPALVFICKFDQHTAQGTTLAMMVPPIGIMAAWTYYKAGYVDIRVAGILAIGFVFGGLIGARYATHFSGPTLQRVFGVGLLLIAVKMIVGK